MVDGYNNIDRVELYKNRPLSPHLTIYRPQITSMLSILHRMTGFALYFGLIILVWWLIIGVYSKFSPEIVVWQIFSTLIWKFCIFGWSVSIFFHSLNGIRHLFWDAGYGFSICATTRSGWAVIFGTVILTFISWTLVYSS